MLFSNTTHEIDIPICITWFGQRDSRRQSMKSMSRNLKIPGKFFRYRTRAQSLLYLRHIGKDGSWTFRNPGLFVADFLWWYERFRSLGIISFYPSFERRYIFHFIKREQAYNFHWGRVDLIRTVGNRIFSFFYLRISSWLLDNPFENKLVNQDSSGGDRRRGGW